MPLRQLLDQVRDRGFYVIFYLISKYTHSFTVMTLVVACFFYIPLSKLIEKYSDDPGLSCLILLAFNFFQFSMTGMRQTMAFGLIMLIYMELLEKRPRYIRALILLGIAITLHRSSYIAALLFIIRWVSSRPWVKKNTWMLSVGIPIVYILRTPIVLYASYVVNDTRYAEITEKGGGVTTYLVFFLIIAAGFIARRSYDKDNDHATFDTIVMLLATALQALVMVESVMFRIVWYFSIYMIIYLPRLAKRFPVSSNSNNLPSTVVYGAVLYMYLFLTIGSATVLPYRFFWQ